MSSAFVKIKKWMKSALRVILNPRLLLCFVIAWMITNGWSYVLFGIGIVTNVTWMTAVGGAYLAFLWLPISPEKIVTVAISIILLRFLFPNDQKTLAVLVHMRDSIKEKMRQRKTKKTAAAEQPPHEEDSAA